MPSPLASSPSWRHALSALLLQGCNSIHYYPAKDSAPAYLVAKQDFPLQRLLEAGIDHSGLEAMDKLSSNLCPYRHRNYLLSPEPSDIKWALEYLRGDSVLLRTVLQREARSVTPHNRTYEDLRGLSNDELFNRFRKLLTKIPLEEGDIHSRWHRLLIKHTALPFEDYAAVMKQLSRAQSSGMIEREGDIYYPVRGSDQWHILGDSCRLILDRAGLHVLEIQDFEAQTYRFDSLREWQEWITQKAEGDSWSLASGQVGIELPELGGLGDLHQWEALIGGSGDTRQPPVEELMDEQPPDAWMPGMNGVFVRAVPDERVAESPAELAYCVQLHNLGNLIHLGCPVQPSRLGRQPEAVRLFQPVNPFRAAPLPMSARD